MQEKQSFSFLLDVKQHEMFIKELTKTRQQKDLNLDEERLEQQWHHH